MIIAIDGPAASGKGTLGKRLAAHYRFRHLDTGVIYRAVAKAMLDAGADLTDEMLAVSAALELDPEKFGNPTLKTQAVGEAASVVSAIPAVRNALVNFQRHFAEEPPGQSPFLGLKNVVLTPHLGASTAEAQVNVSIEAAQLLSDFLATGNVRFAVNMASI